MKHIAVISGKGQNPRPNAPSKGYQKKERIPLVAKHWQEEIVIFETQREAT